MEFVVHGDAYAELAFAHAEGAAEFDLVTEIVLSDQTLELLHDLTGAFDVAGRADTNSDFH